MCFRESVATGAGVLASFVLGMLSGFLRAFSTSIGFLFCKIMLVFLVPNSDWASLMEFRFQLFGGLVEISTFFVPESSVCEKMTFCRFSSCLASRFSCEAFWVSCWNGGMWPSSGVLMSS